MKWIVVVSMLSGCILVRDLSSVTLETSSFDSGPDTTQDMAEDQPNSSDFLSVDVQVDSQSDVSADVSSSDSSADLVEDQGMRKPTDWTDRFQYVLNFEDEEDILANSGSSIEVLTNAAVSPIVPGTQFEGTGTAKIERDTSEASTSVSEFIDLSSGISVGVWMDADLAIDTMELVSVSDHATGAGVDLSVTTNGGIECIAFDGVGVSVGVGSSLNMQEWFHIACVFDAVNGIVRVYRNGVEIQSGTGISIVGSNTVRFHLGNEGVGEFGGSLDEVFIYRSVLDRLTINRIYQCGIDGERCECLRDTAEYSTCRFPPCEGLPACNAVNF